jgi:hypothetical protein
MNVRRLLSFASPLFLLSLTAMPARAGVGSAYATGTLLAGNTPKPLSGLLFLVGVGAVSATLELRRRAAMRRAANS